MSDLLKLADQCGAFVEYESESDNMLRVTFAPGHWEAFTAALAAPPAGISPAPLAGTLDGWEVIGWEYRWLDTANKPNRWSAWERCRARNIHMNTDKDFADEIQAYIDMGNPYELRTLYARAALSQGDVSGEGEGA